METKTSWKIVPLFPQLLKKWEEKWVDVAYVTAAATENILSSLKKWGILLSIPKFSDCKFVLLSLDGGIENGDTIGTPETNEPFQRQKSHEMVSLANLFQRFPQQGKAAACDPFRKRGKAAITPDVFEKYLEGEFAWWEAILFIFYDRKVKCCRSEQKNCG